MSTPLTKLRATLEAKQGNLWEWQGVNPYDGHAFEVLGLAREPHVKPQVVNAAVQRLAQRERLGDRDAMMSERARELLMTPETRVFCELLRMPPVAIPKEEIEQARRAADEAFRDPPSLPPCDEVTLHRDEALARLAARIVEEELQFEPLPEVDLERTEAPAIERQHFAGITFRQRTRKEA